MESPIHTGSFVPIRVGIRNKIIFLGFQVKISHTEGVHIDTKPAPILIMQLIYLSPLYIQLACICCTKLSGIGLASWTKLDWLGLN